jgi:hypothetical protein
MIETLRTLLEQIRTQVAAGDAVDHESIHKICAELTADPSSIPPDSAEEVIRLVNAIAKALTKCQEDLKQELHEIQRSRSALHGYSQLRSADTAQRLRRQV